MATVWTPLSVIKPACNDDNRNDGDNDDGNWDGNDYDGGLGDK